MKAEELKASILQAAIQGKLVPQDPNDEPVSVLIDRIRNEKKRDKNESFIFKRDNHYYENINGIEKCIDDAINYNFPQSWTLARLKNICSIFTGNSINESEKKLKYTNISEGYCYIGTKDVNLDNTVNYDNGIKIPFNNDKFRVAKSKTILMCIEGGSAGKKIGILNEDVCFGNKLCCFDSTFVDSYFLYYSLQCPYFFSVFTSSMAGIIGGVSVNSIKQLILPIPPTNEQSRIVKEIDLLLPLINEVSDIDGKLSIMHEQLPLEIRNSILQHAIQGKLPQ
jgi:type I restriction enzyme S subunit